MLYHVKTKRRSRRDPRKARKTLTPAGLVVTDPNAPIYHGGDLGWCANTQFGTRRGFASEDSAWDFFLRTIFQGVSAVSANDRRLMLGYERPADIRLRKAA